MELKARERGWVGEEGTRNCKEHDAMHGGVRLRDDVSRLGHRLRLPGRRLSVRMLAPSSEMTSLSRGDRASQGG